MINYIKFGKDMAAFNFGQHQDVFAYLDTLEQNGWVIDDAKEWIRLKSEEMTRVKVKSGEKVFTAKFPLCPECEIATLYPFEVNTRPSDQTGDDSKSAWMCSNKNCMHTEYTRQTLVQIYKKLGIKE